MAQPQMQTPAIDLSIVTCCYKYVQRCREFLRSVTRQERAGGLRIEVVVTTPGNPDGVREYLDLASQSYGELRIVRVDAPEAMRRNRGWMIQRAVECSAGATVMVADCDIVLPAGFARTVVAASRAAPDRVLGVYRNLLSPRTTAAILTGLIDPGAPGAFERLAREDHEEAQGYRGVLGYCQIVQRAVVARTPYPEEFDHIAKSDVEWLQRLAREQGVQPGLIPDLRVLHLHHPRNWNGTEVFL